MGHESFETIQQERRHCERVPVNGAAAAALERGYVGVVYELVDISPGGAQLCGPQSPPVSSFELLMYISNHYWERRARQVWMRGDCVGIEFERLGEGAFDALRDDDANLARRAASASNSNPGAAVLVIDGYFARAADLCNSLALLGSSALVASTLLEAVEILDQDIPKVSVVVIAPTLSSCSGSDLSSYIGVTYPGVPRLLMNERNSSKVSFGGVEGLSMADALRAALGECRLTSELTVNG